MASEIRDMTLMSRFLSDKSYDTLLADVWSLGLILAQILVGLNKLDNTKQRQCEESRNKNSPRIQRYYYC